MPTGRLRFIYMLYVNRLSLMTMQATGMRPRIEAVPSVAAAPNECWSTDLCRVWAGRDG